MPQIYIESYGCSNNKAESEMIRAKLSSAGCSFTNNPNLADFAIINTCVVKDKTINKIKRKIQDYSKKFDNGRRLIIAGCMPETLLKEIINLSPNCSIISTHKIKKINSVVKKILEGKRVVLVGKDKTIKCSLPKLRENKLITIIPISSGCEGKCSYCLASIAKGKLFSYPIDDILKSIESDLKQGAKEVWITSQDNANYGMDKSISSQNKSENNSYSKLLTYKNYQDNYKDSNQKLPELLNRILNLNYRFKLRLGMMDPNNVIPIINELIEIYKNPKMYKFLHIPIQSASNKILKHMNRLYTIEQAEEIIEKFKSEIPNITISTDIIVGYPTETEKDHIKNINFIKKIKPDVFNLSKFSSHKQTKAGKLKVLSPDIIHKRASELMQAHRQTALENKQKFLNKTIKVFANKKLENNLYEARDDYYNIILINSKEKILGKNIKVKIKDIGVHHMIAERI